jgi:hypothetical protein
MDTEYTKGFRAGSAYEQERIIKLLEKLDDDPCYVCGDLSKAIELIKGETND